MLNCVSHKKLLKFCLWLGKFIVLYFYFTGKSIWKAIIHCFCLGFSLILWFKQPHTLLMVFNLFNKANLSLLHLDTNLSRVGLVYGILIGELAYLMHFLFIESNVKNSTSPINIKHLCIHGQSNSEPMQHHQPANHKYIWNFFFNSTLTFYWAQSKR